MKAQIISVGTELLLGQIANTDAQYISQCLSEIGIEVYYHIAVGDNRQRIKSTIENAAENADIVILTGGLGPTNDDMTKEVLCEYLGLESVVHEKSLDRLKKRFEMMKKELTENNIKQVLFPKDATVLDNDRGTAPGMLYERNGQIFIALPGPPSELNYMFSTYVMPVLRAKSDCVIKSRVLRIFGIGESKMESVIRDILDEQSNPTIAPLLGNGDVTLRITARAENEEEADRLIAPAEEALRKRLGEYIYGTDDDNPEKVLVHILKCKKLTVSTAESCTGGLVSSRITDVSGASDVLKRAYVTYCNDAKKELLGVPEDILLKYGAISQQTAEYMAKGLLKAANSDIAIAVTGNAGPTAAEDKETGLVFTAVASKAGQIFVRENHFVGTREKVKFNAATTAIIDAVKLAENIN